MRFRWRLTPLQWDVVWTELGLGEYPFPLQVGWHGSNDAARARLREQVRTELVADALIRSGRLDGELAAALTVLARPKTWWDSVWLPDEQSDSPVRVISATDGRLAAVVRQEPGSDGNAGAELSLAPIPPAQLVQALVAELPPARPGGTPEQRAAAGHQEPDDFDQAGGVLVSADSRPSEEQRSKHTVRQLVECDHPAAGQIAANVRDRPGRVHRSAVLRWFDNAGDGRYALLAATDRDRQQRVTVRPVDATALGAMLSELRAALPG